MADIRGSQLSKVLAHSSNLAKLSETLVSLRLGEIPTKTSQLLVLVDVLASYSLKRPKNKSMLTNGDLKTNP